MNFDFEVNPGSGKARMGLTNLEIEDYHNLGNALSDGPSVNAKVSFNCQWNHVITTRQIRNPDPLQRFTGTFRQTQATVKWSASESGFSFHSDPPETSIALFAEVGEEHNGVFFS